MDALIAQIRAANSENPRHEAIIAWAQSQNPIQLYIISHVYRQVPDERIRQLIEEVEHAYLDLRRFSYKIRNSYAPFDKALIALEEAMRAYLANDRVKASDYLAQALQLHPTWKADVVVEDFAGFVLDMMGKDAINTLTAPENAGAFRMARGARWWQRRRLREQHITPRRVTLSVAGVGLILVVDAVLFWLLTTQVWVDRITAPLNRSNGSLAREFKAFAAPEVGWVLVVLLLALLGMLVVFLLDYGMHLVASIMFDGHNLALYTLGKLAPVQVTAAGLGSLVIFIGLVVTVNANSFGRFNGDVLRAMSNAGTLALVAPSLLALVLVTAYTHVRQLSGAYAFSLIDAAFSVLIGGIGGGLLSLGIVYLVLRWLLRPLVQGLV